MSADPEDPDRRPEAAHITDDPDRRPEAAHIADDPGRRLALGLLGLGGLTVGCVLAGLGLGYLLDRVTGATPLFLFLGLGLGILAAVAGTWRAVHDELEH